MNKIIVALALLLGVAACAPQSTVVLVPDADGHVGRIEVSAAQGQPVVLEQANSASSVAKGEAPSPAQTLRDADIQKTWSDALAAMPDRPVTFQLYFESGTATLRADALTLVDQAAGLALRRPFARVMIAGHADATGSAEINDRISRQRADAVRALMVARNVPAQSIQTSSHGKRNPLIATPDGVSEPRNRRVTVTIQ